MLNGRKSAEMLRNSNAPNHNEHIGMTMTSLIKAFFGSPLFTWWNSPTFGTRLFTSMNGVKVGTDAEGNVYYKEKKGHRRWVIYKGGVMEASRVPAEWHGWLHYTVDELPSEQNVATKAWEKEHQANKTGSAASYAPATPRGSVPDYEAWRP